LKTLLERKIQGVNVMPKKRIIFLASFLVLSLSAVAIAAAVNVICSETGLPEHSGLITQKGAPVTLLGNMPKVGEVAPDFTVVDNEMNPVDFAAAYKGKLVLISAVYSLDTAVCDLETRKFNEEAAKLGKDVVILTLSMDLPMMQKRWCGMYGIDKVVTLSDYRFTSFGANYGMLVKGKRMLARGIFLVDREGKIRYIELVKDIASEPNYDAAIAAVKKLL
jgi:thioredoxin-dependent peroxiredoxin